MTQRHNIIFENSDDIEWFKETYPNGSLSWLCSMMLEKFRQAHTFTPSDYARIAAEELRDELS